MAHSAWLKGGYTGKLGATIGQFQNGKPIVKAYAVPKNPRTPAQEANRRRFAVANEYVNALKFLGSFPEIEGEEKNRFQSQRIQFFLQNQKKWQTSLRGLGFKSYEPEYNLTNSMEGWRDGADFGISIFSQWVSEEETFLHRKCSVGFAIYDYEEPKFYFGFTPTFEYVMEEDFDYYFTVEETITIKTASETPLKNFACYGFFLIDDVKYETEYFRLAEN